MKVRIQYGAIKEVEVEVPDGTDPGDAPGFVTEEMMKQAEWEWTETYVLATDGVTELAHIG